MKKAANAPSGSGDLSYFSTIPGINEENQETPGGTESRSPRGPLKDGVMIIPDRRGEKHTVVVLNQEYRECLPGHVNRREPNRESSDRLQMWTRSEGI